MLAYVNKMCSQMDVYSLFAFFIILTQLPSFTFAKSIFDESQLILKEKNEEIGKLHHITDNVSNSRPFVIKKRAKADKIILEQDLVLTDLEFTNENTFKLTDYVKGIGEKREQLKLISKWIELQLEKDTIHPDINITTEMNSKLTNITALEFNGDNIRKLSEHVRGIHQDRGKLKEFFERLVRHFEEEENQLNSIHPEMNIMTDYYIKDKEEISKSLSMLYRYLNDTEHQSNRKDFFHQVSILPASLNSLINGLLGQKKTSIRGDILVDLCATVKCNGRKLRKGLKVLMGKITVGILIFELYSPNTNTYSSCFQNSFDKILFRVHNDILANCQADETHVAAEMHGIINSYTGTKPKNFRKGVAAALLHFLEDKYDTKKWIVFVLPEFGARNKVYSIQSGGFHKASARGLSALAVSTTDPNEAPEFFKQVDGRFNRFSYSSSIPSYRQVYGYLNRFLTPLKTSNNGVIETLVINSQCSGLSQGVVTMVASTGTKLIKTNSICDNLLLIAVKVLKTQIPYAPIECPDLRNAVEKTSEESNVVIDCKNVVAKQPISSFSTGIVGCQTEEVRRETQSAIQFDSKCEVGVVLRNEFSQGYLSVLDESNGAYVILDRQFKNSPGQRWRFVDNQLRNDYGKCLTRLSSTYLYHYDCNPDWAGQKLKRVGLQIMWVDGGDCLYFESPLNEWDYVVGEEENIQCQLTSPFVWYDWDAQCDDAVVIRSTGNQSRPLRNEFSRLFLTADAEYAFQLPWSNQPGQQWRFVHGWLMNDDGRCLVDKGTYVRSENCSTAQSNVWTYNEKRQIVNVQGYCLSVGDKVGYILHNSCLDHPQYRWYF